MARSPQYSVARRSRAARPRLTFFANLALTSCAPHSVPSTAPCLGGAPPPPRLWAAGDPPMHMLQGDDAENALPIHENLLLAIRPRTAKSRSCWPGPGAPITRPSPRANTQAMFGPSPPCHPTWPELQAPHLAFSHGFTQSDAIATRAPQGPPHGGGADGATPSARERGANGPAPLTPQNLPASTAPTPSPIAGAFGVAPSEELAVAPEGDAAPAPMPVRNAGARSMTMSTASSKSTSTNCPPMAMGGPSASPPGWNSRHTFW